MAMSGMVGNAKAKAGLKFQLLESDQLKWLFDQYIVLYGQILWLLNLLPSQNSELRSEKILM